MNLGVVIGIVALAGLVVYGLFIEGRRRSRRGKQQRMQQPLWTENGTEHVIELDADDEE